MNRLALVAFALVLVAFAGYLAWWTWDVRHFRRVDYNDGVICVSRLAGMNCYLFWQVEGPYGPPPRNGR
jgi:TRAP-type C4-dicarboxylate transport system permease small subunit|tara:strand:+ start:51 stop:257 length:207 start_codon:yes stop_codon:yes gene_type:complete